MKYDGKKFLNDKNWLSAVFFHLILWWKSKMNDFLQYFQIKNAFSSANIFEWIRNVHTKIIKTPYNIESVRGQMARWLNVLHSNFDNE